MARKPKQQTTAGRPAGHLTPVSDNPSSKSQAQTQPIRNNSIWRSVNTQRALCLVILAAIYAPLSQQVLSPVYGSIPSSVYHKYGLIGASMLAFALRGNLPEVVERLVPTFAYWIPTIQFVLFRYSSILDNPRGPLVTELVTTFPLITLSLYMATKLVEDLDLSFLNSNALAEAGPPMTFYFLFTIFQRLLSSALPTWIGGSIVTSRLGFQIAVATIYGLLLPQSSFWPSVPSVAFTMLANPHMPLQRTTTVLENTLSLYDYALLERRESLTGYISVLEDKKKEFRVMRCDHSLLGGEWQVPPPAGVNRRVGEPIYAIFTMLEAVRLINPPPSTSKIQDQDAKALIIGLGVGTAPSALIAHGIQTTIIELDPTVHYFAGKYFNLPKNHSYVLGDAVDFVNSHSSSPSPQKYNYIIHDTFTGGALPIPLFTQTFLTSLSTLLTQDGVIAINYAGDLKMPSASTVHRTITAVFPNCKIYREDPEPDPESTSDFTNLVYFCTHPSQSHGIAFRRATEADFLGSGARKAYLVPKHEVDPDVKFETQGGILDVGHKSGIKEVARWQAESAVGHWRLMRGVIRDEIWENW